MAPLPLSDLTPEILTRLYDVGLRTDAEIAALYGTYQVKINRIRQRWGIGTLGKTGRLTKLMPSLTDQQKQVLIGSLLGDGTMSSPGPLSARFGESHCLAQEGYLRWKADILGEHVSCFFDSDKTDKETGKVYPGKGFITHASTHLRPLYDLFYGTGSRVFPSNIHTLMTPLVLAVWFMDDGTASGYHPRIAFGLCETSLMRVTRALRKLGLTPTVHGGSGDVSIHFPGQAELFYSLVGSHIPECMKYKLPEMGARRRVDKNAKVLTPEMAQTLFEGGITKQGIAKLYSVGTSTVGRRIQMTGAPKLMGRPRRLYSRPAADVLLSKYDPKVWPTLSNTEKDRWVEEAFKVLRALGFPHPVPMSGEQAQGEYERVLGAVPVREGQEVRPRSYLGLRLCEGYFPNRYQAAWRGKKSAFQSWFIDADLRRAIRFQLDGGDPVLPHRVLRAITMQTRTPSMFKPIVAKYIYQTYCPVGGTVWDPCIGYGGRMLGALASGVHYIGTDVEVETVGGNQRLADVLGRTADVDLHHQAAEAFDCPPVDLVFTSPPYFDVEQYGGDANQSFRKFGGFDVWVQGFLRPLAERAFAALRHGGHLVLNVADIIDRNKVYPLVGETRRMAAAAGFTYVEELRMPISNLNKKSDGEPILVFRR